GFCSRVLSEIPRIAADFSLILSRTGVPGRRDSPQHLVDGRRGRPTPRWATKNVVFAVIETHLSHGLHRTHDNRTPYAVDVTGGGRSSATSRRMSVNRFLGMATSAIWKAT